MSQSVVRSFNVYHPRSDFVHMYCTCPYAGIHVGYSRPMYTISEDEGHIELCVKVKYSQSGAARPFSLSVFTSDGTACEQWVFSTQ